MQRIRDRLQAEQPNVWLFYGDSITHGALHTNGHRDYPELFEERVRFELGRRMDIIINTAISGNNTNALLDSFDWRVARFQPHVVFIMIGMNDCNQGCNITVEQFKQNLHTIKEKLDTIGAMPVLQTTCPILPGSTPGREPYFDDYMDAVRRAAEQLDVPLVDHTAYWREQSDRLYYWMSNAFHPNEYGHRAFARTLFRDLGIDDPESSKTCQLFIP